VKRCTKCGEVKPLSEFYKNKRQSSGLNPSCKACKGKYYKGYLSSNREKVNARNKAYREANPDWYTNQMLKNSYNLTVSEYTEMLNAQNGVCAVCGGNNKGKRLAVDHDHKTGAVRGLLCFKCNVALGFINDSPIVAERMITYLQSAMVTA
jgi:hypothetical protein